MNRRKYYSTTLLSAAFAAALCAFLPSCNKADPDYSLLTSQEVKVVIDGNGESITCPYCGGKILPDHYHHHYNSHKDLCPIDSCEFEGEDHMHCFYNGQGVCPGHERGHGGMGGGSYN